MAYCAACAPRRRGLTGATAWPRRHRERARRDARTTHEAGLQYACTPSVSVKACHKLAFPMDVSNTNFVLDRVSCTEVSQFGHHMQIGTTIANFYISVPTLVRVFANKAKTRIYMY